MLRLGTFEDIRIIRRILTGPWFATEASADEDNQNNLRFFGYVIGLETDCHLQS